jgi:xylan 1,4-beta-xylosidase
MTRTYRNPIIPGFYPDPSICRVGEDYYLVTSTFEYFPGVPIFHSRDLVHWEQIGHVLDRPSQLNLDDVPHSYGIFAPTLRYHDGVFYMVTTLADPQRKFHNFIVTATQPEGPYSEPYFLNDAPGIDPSLFFDDDERVWYTGNRNPMGADHRVSAKREIWLQELDLATMQLVGEKYVLWDGITRGEQVPEAPHLFKVDGSYILLVAEGGTYHDHMVTVARSSTLTGTYESNIRNPILTHKHLGTDHPIINTGHADMVQTQAGEWWMVALASRPYDGYFYNLGRETFLVPMRFEEGFPLVNPGKGIIEFEHPAPDLPETRFPAPPACDHFEGEALALCWNFLRTPREPWWSLSERPGFLRLKLRPQRLSDYANPSFIGRRQQHIHFAARAALEFTPASGDECAGLVLIQNAHHHFRFTVTLNAAGERVVRLEQRAAGVETVIGEQPVAAGRLYLKVEAVGMAYTFSVAERYEQWRVVAENVDGRILSTSVAQGFTGVYVGMYASSNGAASANAADFDWFEYLGE